MEETVVTNALKQIAIALAIQIEAERIPFYEMHLKSFSQAELDTAVKKIVGTWRYRYFPSPSYISDCCKISSSNPRDSFKPVGDFMERIKQAENRARKNANDFTERFGQSGLAIRARNEGWHNRLKEHVYAVAEYHYFKKEQEAKNLLNFGHCIYATVNGIDNLVDPIKARQGGDEPVVELDQKLIDAWKEGLPKTQVKRDAA